jgi:hypothetical protein
VNRSQSFQYAWEPLPVRRPGIIPIQDDGIFDQPLEKIGRFNHDPQAPHAHAAILSQKVVKTEGNQVWVEGRMANFGSGGTHFAKWVLTVDPPTAYTLEYTDGPQKGSWFTNSYTALGTRRTRVEVEGEFEIRGLDEPRLRRYVLAFFAQAFAEDVMNLQGYP